MKAKTRRLTASALSVIAAALLGCSAALAVDRAEAAETEPSAAHVMTTAEYGSDWESSPYGKDGWAVLSATGGTVYSNLYTENASYDAEAQSVALAGWANNDANTWLTTEDGKTLDAAEELRPGASRKFTIILPPQPCSPLSGTDIRPPRSSRYCRPSPQRYPGL